MTEIEATEVIDRENLAVIGQVERLEAIPFKDRIELVFLKDCGFTFICEKGHQVDDFVVYVKYDTIVPNNELFGFLSESKFRVKAKAFTEKDEFDNVIKKIYSQGIVISFDKFKRYVDTETPFWDDLEDGFEGSVWTWKLGDDVTKLLGIKKYIATVKSSGTSFGNMQAKGDFPTHLLSKTDEPNLASRMRALQEIQGMSVYITTKIEGASITFGHNEEDEFFVCSRNNMLKENDNKFWQAIEKNDLKEKLKVIPNIICQAELYGIGIQNNKLGIPDVDLAVFTMVDRETRRRLSFDEMFIIAERYEIPLVSLNCIINSFDWSFEKLQEYADIMKYEQPKESHMGCLGGKDAEGIVIRPMEPFFSNVLKDIWSVKVINRNYKL
jgi:RNA ligase (TIGR02306 family)